jgi:hypothetical protein
MRSVSFLGVVVLAAPSALHLGVPRVFSGDFFACSSRFSLVFLPPRSRSNSACCCGAGRLIRSADIFFPHYL